MPRLVAKSLSSRATRYIRSRPSPSPTVNTLNTPACQSRARPSPGGSSRRPAPTHTLTRTHTRPHTRTHAHAHALGQRATMGTVARGRCGNAHHRRFRFRFREPGARRRIGMWKDVLVRRFLLAAGLLPKTPKTKNASCTTHWPRPCLAKRRGRATWTQSCASGGGQFKPLARR